MQRLNFTVCKRLIISVLPIFGAATVLAQDVSPKPRLLEVEKLVESEKYPEALAKLDELIRDYPNDASFKELRRQVAAAAPAATATPAAGGATKVSKLDLAELELIAKEAQGKPEGSADRARLLHEYMEKSAPLLQQDAGLQAVWTHQAAAALELNLPQAGWYAGRALLKLGADSGQDRQSLTVLAALKRRGWLKESFAEVQREQDRQARDVREQAERTARAAEAAATEQFRLAVTGQWQRKWREVFGTSVYEKEAGLTLKWTREGNPEFTLTDIETEKDTHGGTAFESKSVSSAGTVSYNTRAFGGVNARQALSGTSNLLQSNIQLDPSRRVVIVQFKLPKTIRLTGKTEGQNDSVDMPVESYNKCFFLVPAGQALVEVAEADRELPLEQLTQRYGNSEAAYVPQR